MKPLAKGVINFSIFRTLQQYLNGANYHSGVRGFSAAYMFGASQGFSQELRYSFDWRSIYGILDDASVTVRRSAGHSVKSSVGYVVSRCTRDSSVFPTRGSLFRLSHELAGLGGSVHFFKNDLVAQANVPIYRQCILRLGMRAGLVVPLSGTKISILDKYQLGGPLSVRGFVLNSLGPKDRNDPIGGDLALEGGVQLAFPLSPSTSSILRGHLFANAGVLLAPDYSRSMRHNLGRWLRDEHPNVSVGAGLMVRLGEAARLELNLAYPLRMQPSAAFHRGVQLGLGVEFL